MENTEKIETIENILYPLYLIFHLHSIVCKIILLMHNIYYPKNYRSEKLKLKTCIIMKIRTSPASVGQNQIID